MEITAAELGPALARGEEVTGEWINAALIREFCVHHAAEVDPKGIRLRGVHIVGSLDLRNVEVPFGLRLRECVFDRAPILHGARIKQLALTNCPRLPGLLANGLTVQGDIDLSGSHIVGSHDTSASLRREAAVWLAESVIGGRFHCLGTIIDGQGHRAIHADRMKVGGTVRLIDGFEATGELRLVGLEVAGSLDLTGCKVTSDGLALDLADANLLGNLYLGADGDRRPEFRGLINLSSTSIDGRLLIQQAILARPEHNEGQYASPRDQGKVIIALRLIVGAELAIEGATTITGGIDLASAELGRLTIEPGCTIDAPNGRALDLTNAQVRASVTIGEGVRVRGLIMLAGAHIQGRLRMQGVELTEPEGHSLLKTDGATIDGDVELQGLRATGGQVKFWHTTIGGSVEAAGAILTNPGGGTLRIHQSRVGGTIRLIKEFTSIGCVVLSRTNADGGLDLTDGIFTCDIVGLHNNEQLALRAVSSNFRGGMHLAWRTIRPAVNFTDTTTSVLRDDPGTWPGRIAIAGFTYERLDAARGFQGRTVWDWKARRAWLLTQVDFDSGPYEQAARVFRQHGYARGAEQLLIAQRKDARRRDSRSRLRGLPDWFYQVAVGYGYRPGRVLLLITALLVAVGVMLSFPSAQQTMRANDQNGAVFTVDGPLVPADHPTDACGDGQVRCFNPALYAIDTVVPLIALDQRSTWYPDEHLPGGVAIEWALNIATVIGWLLSSIFLLSFARLARNA